MHDRIAAVGGPWPLTRDLRTERDYTAPFRTLARRNRRTATQRLSSHSAPRPQRPLGIARDPRPKATSAAGGEATSP